MKQFRLDGAKALITGAGTGMGRATAKLFAEAGCSALVLTGRRSEKLQETAAALGNEYKSCRVLPLPCDVSAAKSRRDLVARIKAEGIGIDFLINNAGLFAASPVRDTSDAAWQTMFAVNVEGPFALIRDCCDMLAASGRGAVVTISSTLAQKPIPHTAAYNASKAAVLQMSRTLALELGPQKVRVNCIMPAIVETPMYRGRYRTDKEYDDAIKAMGPLHPLGRVGQAEDIANAVLFLCSEAAAWITGVALPVDGGMLCT